MTQEQFDALITYIKAVCLEFTRDDKESEWEGSYRKRRQRHERELEQLLVEPKP